MSNDSVNQPSSQACACKKGRRNKMAEVTWKVTLPGRNVGV